MDLVDITQNRDSCCECGNEPPGYVGFVG